MHILKAKTKQWVFDLNATSTTVNGHRKKPLKKNILF